MIIVICRSFSCHFSVDYGSTWQRVRLSVVNKMIQSWLQIHYNYNYESFPVVFCIVIIASVVFYLSILPHNSLIIIWSHRDCNTQ